MVSGDTGLPRNAGEEIEVRRGFLGNGQPYRHRPVDEEGLDSFPESPRTNLAILPFSETLWFLNTTGMRQPNGDSPHE
jgi:hypothetical protein